MGHSWYPIRPRKNITLTLVMGLEGTDGTGPTSAATTAIITTISLDGGDTAATTNTPALVGTDKPVVSLVLTSTEMNADNVVVVFSKQTSSKFIHSISIFPLVDELTAAPGVTIGQDAKLQSLFQYFFLKRECTASAETMYKSDGSTTIGSNTLSDNGTTVTKGKIG